MADHRLQIVLAAKDVTGTAFTKLQGRMKALTKSVFSLKGGLVAMAGAYGMKLAATAALDVASSFEQMQVKLDALTKGKGAETLDKINAWALEMPVNTRKAVDTFAMMQAMGLDPTIEKMQTLVDTSSIFGQEAMPRVARALGQMATLGKLSAEELNQMSEAGINARKYLTEAFGMTVQELQKSQVSIEEIIDAIWQGLDADFGGAASKAQDSWQGMTLTFKSYMEEMLKQVMDAGVFDVMKQQLDTVNAGLKEWIKNNEELIRQKVPIYLEHIANAMRATATAAEYAWGSWMKLLDTTGIGHLIDLYQQYVELATIADNRPAGAMDFDAQEASAVRYKESLAMVVTETKKLATVTDALDQEIIKFNQELDGMALAATQYAAPAIDELDKMIEDFNNELSGAALAATDYSDAIAKAMKESSNEAAGAIEHGMGNALANIVTQARTAKEAFADFAKSTISWMVKMLSRQAMSSIFSSFSLTPAAQGAVFDQSGLVPFDRGGIVNRPTIFPFASGIGLMGEGGRPEAILPLTRTSGGDLGVKTEGGTGGGSTIIINAVDAKSFDDMVRRNSESIVKVVQDNLIGNGSLRSTMKRTL